jgi:hypothetical protein
MPGSWVTFRRHDLTGIVRVIQEVATSGDAGAFGHGVEIVVESPHHRWWRRVFDRSERDRARIAITGRDGSSGYPIHVRLVTGYGPGAASRIDRRDNWATSVTSMRLVTARPATGGDPVPPHPHEAGEAIIMLKRGTVPDFDPADAAREVITGTVAALADLHPFSPERGWRARVDRDVRRT